MKSIFALSTLVFAHAVFAQSGSLSSSSGTATGSYSASSSASASSMSGTASRTASTSGTASVKAAAASATAASSAIPTGISQSCTTYLNTLNSDAQIGTCTSPLLTATSAFAPSSLSSTTTASLTTTLNTLCAASKCPDTAIRSQLVDFYSACSAELTGDNQNDAVKDTYDILYILNPLTSAVCTKDANTQEYCVLKIAPGAASGMNGTLANVANNAVTSDTTSDDQLIEAAVADFTEHGTTALSKRSTSSGNARRGETVLQYAPNTQVYRDNGIMYLFTLPSLSASALCTNCTQAILSVYASWESTVPYACGLSNSPMLGSQAELWSETKTKCGASFLAAIQASAGNSEPTGVTTNGGKASISFGHGSGLAVVAAVAMSIWIAL